MTVIVAGAYLARSRRVRWLVWTLLSLGSVMLVLLLVFSQVAAELAEPGQGGGGCIAGIAAPPPPGSPAQAGALSPEQQANAAAIVAAGRAMSVPDRGLWIAIAVALQESGLRNITYGDRDSMGLFQQRPSQSWGTPQQVADPQHAATAFFTHLLAIPGWENMPLGNAAQAVQRSAFPNAYTQWEQPAANALAAAGGTPATCAGSPATSEQAGTAIEAARAQLGKPYVWGATGPNAFDCSGLTMASWRAAGVQLPRTAAAQAASGQRIPFDQLQPGDLLFLSYNGQVSAVHHVMLYLGAGQVVEAPETGVPVRVRAVGLPTAGKPAERQLMPFGIRPCSSPSPA